MKRSPVVAVVFVVVAAGAGCGPPVITFDVPVSGETTVDSGGLIGELLGGLGFDDFAALDLEGTQEFKNEDVRKEQVTSAFVTSLNLSIQEPQGANFDWLNAIAFSASADDVDTEEVASADIPDGKSAVACEVAGVDVGPYIRADSFSITTEVEAVHPPQDTTVRVDVVFKISAEAF
jgi:hypothetical protein